ncbi:MULTISPECIES: hypothetical protein [Bacteroides]|jgi:hypothetical protein|uniref:hypothetical protein n=1 Tax=Bacteroides TaxID=816 RepID=UPI000318EE80|nr:hypothetical protein [Bacteroides sp. 1_1_30]
MRAKNGQQYRIAETLTRKPMGERRVKVQPSPANAEEQGIVKGEGCFCKIEK